ncbi:hepatocyte growth factor receptor-like isoform X2 [Gigantopelta aegis]|uniref:hepatocyte growth factor receptor-like isoform X2 n=1 Tax=Gigantopelta aegis TaxID=1735272 RepID=UPI001B88869A|nr:hepatocyte growth factor receptor-like isoform X2 [Gigantopelta aegis]
MYYRLTDEFVCNRSCPNCNTHGRNPNRHCMQIGGNCSCKANVEGTLCDMCKHLTYKLGPSTEGCTQSNCSSDGSESCNNETGSCNCYPNVTGNTCDRCSPLHYNITSGRGCESCLCSSKGTVKKNLQCNVTSGKCDCKTNVTGRQCDECKDDYWNLESTNDVGCTKCVCNMIGSTNSTCNKQTGQCPCWNNDDSNTECNPTSTSVIPKFGPQVGGTLVTVSGHLLNGSSMYFPKIYLDGNNTSIISKSETRIIFKTSKMDVSKELDVELRWHQQSYLIKLGKFSYRPDPAITLDTIPAVTTFGSGGCRVTMKGTNLDSVYQPKVKVSTGSEVHEAVCEVENSGVMKCPTPRLNTSSPNSSFSLDLELDGVKYTNVTQVTVVHDPQLKDAKIVDFKYPFEKTVTLHGARLQAACHAEDVTVMIGKGQCRNIKLSDTTITCEPPADAPGNGNEFTIHVSIGFFNQSVGKLYYKPWWETRYFVFIVVGIAAFLILVFAILIAICCCVCRKRRRRNRNLNNENEESAKFTDVALDPGAELLPVSEPSSASRGSDSTFAIDNPAYTMEPAAVDTDMVIITESFLHQLEESIRGNVGECLINGDQFEIGNICSHKGTISRVVNGNFTFSAEKNPNVKLTIKMPIKAVADTAKLPTWTSSVLREALRLRKHVSGSTHRIYGIGLDNKYFYLLYPYMENRTLKDHIVKSSNNFQLCQLVRFCVDVAEGMDFLASKDIVHKDLAARNCWVDSNQMVMVSLRIVCIFNRLTVIRWSWYHSASCVSLTD